LWKAQRDGRLGELIRRDFITLALPGQMRAIGKKVKFWLDGSLLLVYTIGCWIEKNYLIQGA
jgi:hypothetical protein